MDGPDSQVFNVGNDRSYHGTSQNVYSKYNLTYRWQVASALDNLTGLASMTGNTYASAVSGYAAARTDLLDTIGKQIAAYPTTTSLTQFNTSAGEVMSGNNIPEISFSIQQQPIVARTRKFRTLWTIEAQQDLRAYHNLDLEKEVTELMSQEVQLEINRELIEDLRVLEYDIECKLGAFRRGALDSGNLNKLD